MLSRIIVPFLLVGLMPIIIGSADGFTQVSARDGTDGNSVKLIQTKYSKKAVRLVLKNMGKKVGSGASLALLNVQLKKSRAKAGLKFSLSKKSLPYIAVGDELYFSGTYKNNNVNSTLQSVNNYSKPMHYAIVVGKKDDNTLLIAHQNRQESSPKKAIVEISELMIDDPSRTENINVYGLWPKKKGVNPEKILRTDGKVYEISLKHSEKSDYFVESNFTH